jgi:hypothetical protein
MARADRRRERSMDRSRPGLLAAAFVLLVGVAACGGSDDDSSETTVEKTTTTTDSTTTTKAETTTTEAAAGQAQVDLDITGTYVLNIHEEAGECSGADGLFAFSMTGDDVDGMGDGFTVEQASATEGTIEWAIDDNNSYESSDSATLTFSSDGMSVEIDDDLAQLQQEGTPRPVHVTGTITCT